MHSRNLFEGKATNNNHNIWWGLEIECDDTVRYHFRSYEQGENFSDKDHFTLLLCDLMQDMSFTTAEQFRDAKLHNYYRAVFELNLNRYVIIRIN